jgi:hypothetical protein
MSTMAEVIAAHQPGNMSRERYCTCGAFIGDWATLEDLATHQAEELTKAGYGSIREARDQRDRELHRFGYNWSLDQPPRASYPVDDYECCASGSCEVCRPGLHRGGDS